MANGDTLFPLRQQETKSSKGLLFAVSSLSSYKNPPGPAILLSPHLSLSLSPSPYLSSSLPVLADGRPILPWTRRFVFRLKNHSSTVTILDSTFLLYLHFQQDSQDQPQIHLRLTTRSNSNYFHNSLLAR